MQVGIGLALDEATRGAGIGASVDNLLISGTDNLLLSTGSTDVLLLS